VEKQADFILGEVEKTPALTFEERRAKLKEERGRRFGIGTLWRFFKRRWITLKKRRLMRPSKSGPT
jgi:transposase